MNVQEVDPQGYDQFRKFTTNMLLLSLKEPAPSSTKKERRPARTRTTRERPRRKSSKQE